MLTYLLWMHAHVCRNTMTRGLGIIITLSLLPTCLPQTAENPFRIRLQRDPNSNTITLQCRLTATDFPIPDAMYFLNGTRLENFTELHRGDNPGVTFQIVRDIEGYFSCGNDSTMSNSMALTAFPDSELQVETLLPKYAILGERVKLNCVIPPGRLLQQYYVTWYRSGTIIYQTRRNNPPQTVNARYSADPSDLSLIIDNVQLEDANEEYRCVYTVFAPNVMSQSDNYDNLLLYDIELQVLAEPTISGPPQENITVEGHNASFTCSVQGFPAPVVEWELNGVELSSEFSTTHTRQDGNYVITLSILLITSVTFEMNGEVRCFGRIPTAETGDRLLDEANSTTTLVVYSPPDIDESKLRNSIIAEGENISYVCSVRGYPPPMVTWFLNGTRVLPQDPGTVVYETSSQSGPYNVTTSELVISAAQQRLNGEVQCLARSTNAAIDLSDDNETAKLVVLGSFDLRVDVTQKGDVLFEVTLLTPLSEPVELMMEYIDLDDLFRRKNMTTNVAYIATRSFLHLEPSSRVPFKRFRVSVRLRASSSIGPAVQDINDHAKNRPTLVDPNVLKLEKHKHIIWGAILVAALVTISLLLCCVFCLYYKFKLKQLILNNPKEVLEMYMEQIKNDSIPQELRKLLIEKAGDLTVNIVQYHKERQPATSATRVHIGQEANAIELSEMTNEGALGGPPPPPKDSENRTQSDHVNEEIEDSMESLSLVDEALNAFVKHLPSVTE